MGYRCILAILWRVGVLRTWLQVLQRISPENPFQLPERVIPMLCKSRGIFSPPRWGETAFSIFPPGSGKWGENKVFSPQGPENGGGKTSKNFRRLLRASLKNLDLQGFVVVSSHKLPYSRRFPSTYTLLHVPKRFAVRDSVCLNCIYEYKKALLPFMKTFWVPRLGSSLIFCDYMKTLLSFGITVLRTVRARSSDMITRGRRRVYYSQND